MNIMKKIVVFAMIASMVLGCFVFSTSAATAKEYVKEGLVAWYDASNNSNGSNLPDTDTWKDLSGNVNHVSIASAVSNGQITWSGNSLLIKETGCYLQLPDGVKKALEGDAYTIEIVTGDLTYTATSYITLLSSANDELSVFIRCSATDPADDEYLKLEYKNQDANGDSNRPYMKDAWDQFNGKTLAVTSDLTAFDGTRDMESNTTDNHPNVFMYSDGVEVAKGESEYNMELDYVYFGNTAETRRWGGEIYALRIYNRALTPEEIADNAAADQYNYRQGNAIEPTQQYDPELDKNAAGFVDLSGYNEKIIVFDANTDMIPLTGFYGSQNLLDYLYPYESDEVQWKGARLMKTEENDTDYDGTVLTGTSFDILYQPFCTRAGLTPVAGKDCQYIVIKMVVNGEFEDFTMNTIAYDKDTNDDIEFSTGSLYGGIDFDKEGQSQYLIFDVEGIFDDAESIMKMYVDISGMQDETEIYLEEIGFFATEKEAYEYAGEEYVTEAPKADTEAPKADTEAPKADTEAPKADTEAPKTDDTKAPETTAPDEGGCASVVGFGAAAILVAAAAAVVLKKKD